MTYWTFKYALTAVSAVGSLLGCSYCTALLATIACVTIADHLGERCARRQSARADTRLACGGVA